MHPFPGDSILTLRANQFTGRSRESCSKVLRPSEQISSLTRRCRDARGPIVSNLRRMLIWGRLSEGVVVATLYPYAVPLQRLGLRHLAKIDYGPPRLVTKHAQDS